MLMTVHVPEDTVIYIDQTTIGVVPDTDYTYSTIRNLFETNRNRVWSCLALGLNGTFPGKWFLVRQGKWVVMYIRTPGFRSRVRIARMPYIPVTYRSQNARFKLLYVSV